ncbi:MULTISPECIES: hypothetical protein [unclassified Vreelandella]
MKRWSAPQPPRQLRHTVLFLRTSFEAMQNAIAVRLEDPLPCWLDTHTLSMLASELKQASQAAKSSLPPDAFTQLCVASNQCELLLKQCPGVLSSAVCHRQLGAIVTALTTALVHMAAPAPKRRWFWPS